MLMSTKILYHLQDLHYFNLLCIRISIFIHLFHQNLPTILNRPIIYLICFLLSKNLWLLRLLPVILLRMNPRILGRLSILQLLLSLRIYGRGKLMDGLKLLLLGTLVVTIQSYHVEIVFKDYSNSLKVYSFNC